MDNPDTRDHASDLCRTAAELCSEIDKLPMKLLIARSQIFEAGVEFKNAIDKMQQTLKSNCIASLNLKVRFIAYGSLQKRLPDIYGNPIEAGNLQDDLTQYMDGSSEVIIAALAGDMKQTLTLQSYVNNQFRVICTLDDMKPVISDLKGVWRNGFQVSQFRKVDPNDPGPTVQMLLEEYLKSLLIFVVGRCPPLYPVPDRSPSL